MSSTKPLNSFFTFCQLNRKKIQEEHQQLSNSEISALLGEKWRSLPAEQKIKYRELASQQKREYLKNHPSPSKKAWQGDEFLFSFKLEKQSTSKPSLSKKPVKKVSHTIVNEKCKLVNNPKSINVNHNIVLPPITKLLPPLPRNYNTLSKPTNKISTTENMRHLPLPIPQCNYMNTFHTSNYQFNVNRIN